MALVRNGRNVFTNPGTYGGVETLRHGNGIKGGLRNREFGAFVSTFSAYPNGTRASQSFIQPRSAGSLASYNRARLELVPSATLTPALPMTASGSMAISVLAADLDQIVALIASGSAVISALTANLSAGVLMAANSAASMSVSSAQLGGIIPVDASASMTLTPDVVMTAKAFMVATAGGPTPLSPEGLSQTLLDSSEIESGYSMRESLRLMLAAMAGKVSGAETSTVILRDVNDTKNRIVATVDGNGNRTAVTHDTSD